MSAARKRKMRRWRQKVWLIKQTLMGLDGKFVVKYSEKMTHAEAIAHQLPLLGNHLIRVKAVIIDERDRR